MQFFKTHFLVSFHMMILSQKGLFTIYADIKFIVANTNADM